MIENETLERSYTLPSNELKVQGEQPNGVTSVDSSRRIAIAVYDGD